MTRIDPNKTYVLLPVYDNEVKLESKFLLGKELLKEFKEEYLIQALDVGRFTIFYKGNDYYLDEKIEEN